jgi:putative ABC transport system permease protein
VVIEAAFADALGVHAGDQITLNSRSFRVVGVAVTAAMPPYLTMSPPGTAENPLQYCPLPSPSPCDQPPEPGGGPSPELLAALRRVDAEHPGLVWLTQTDARRLAPQAESLNYVLNLKLDDPAEARRRLSTRTSQRVPNHQACSRGSRSAKGSPPIWSETSSEPC